MPSRDGEAVQFGWKLCARMVQMAIGLRRRPSGRRGPLNDPRAHIDGRISTGKIDRDCAVLHMNQLRAPLIAESAPPGAGYMPKSQYHLRLACSLFAARWS
jgi:hypothetical protein